MQACSGDTNYLIKALPRAEHYRNSRIQACSEAIREFAASASDGYLLSTLEKTAQHPPHLRVAMVAAAILSGTTLGTYCGYFVRSVRHIGRRKYPVVVFEAPACHVPRAPRNQRSLRLPCCEQVHVLSRFQQRTTAGWKMHPPGTKYTVAEPDHLREAVAGPILPSESETDNDDYPQSHHRAGTRQGGRRPLLC